MINANSIERHEQIVVTRETLRRYALKEVHTCPGLTTDQIHHLLVARRLDVRRHAVRLALEHHASAGRLIRYTKIEKRAGKYVSVSAWAPASTQPADPFEGLA